MADLVFREEPTRFRVTVEGCEGLTAEVYQEDGKWAAWADRLVVGHDGRVLTCADASWAHLRDTVEEALESARLALGRVHAERSGEVHGD